MGAYGIPSQRIQSGRPRVSELAEHYDGPRSSGPLPAEVDVLIIGCGPAGLTLAAQLAAFPEIDTRIVEQKSGPLVLGQADGIACRTVEMFHAFGFSERLLKEAYWVNETTFWKPDERSHAISPAAAGSRMLKMGYPNFHMLILNQARVHDFYLQVMRNSPNRLEPDYARRVIDLRIDPAASSGASTPTHPVKVRPERIDPEHEGQVEIVKARYVAGCDGAHSVVRQCLGRTLHGDSANQAWGVMDVLAVTDFPDIRLKTAIQSANEGSVLIIPREGGWTLAPVRLLWCRRSERGVLRHQFTRRLSCPVTEVSR